MINPHHDLAAAVQHTKVRPLVEGETLDKHRAERDLAPLAALELAVWLLMSRELMDDILNSVLRVPRWAWRRRATAPGGGSPTSSSTGGAGDGGGQGSCSWSP